MASLPRGVDGRRRRLRRTFGTRSDAELFLSGLTSEALVPGEDLTVGDLLGDLQESIRHRFEAGQLAVSTVELYALCGRHLDAEFGACFALDVSVDDVERFLARQSERLSSRYVAMQRNVLAQAYRWAQRNRRLDWNPAQLSTCPASSPVRAGSVLSPEQAQRLLKAAEGDRLHALWSVMLGVGLRPGEALALTWQCVDLDVEPAVIHVRSYLRKGPDGMYLGALKTHNSARSLDAPTFVAESLSAHRRSRQSPSEGPWRDLVFLSTKGTPQGHRNLRRALMQLCETAGLPPLTLYDLRRTAGSLLVDAGVHLECVADLLGHSSVATTRRHYERAVRPTVPHAVGLDAVLNQTTSRSVQTPQSLPYAES